jgi:hypothetical protein
MFGGLAAAFPDPCICPGGRPPGPPEAGFRPQTGGWWLWWAWGARTRWGGLWLRGGALEGYFTDPVAHKLPKGRRW